MSDQDELRDKIAAVVEAYLPREHMGYGSGEYAAQAIIDEFGLTVETEPGHDPRECGCSSRAYPAESRVVGKWEAEE